MNIKQLILDCKKQEPKAQGQLYNLLSSKMFSVCLKYSRSYAEAQDNMQDGFLLLFKKIDQFDFKGSFEGWVKRLFINFILYQYRKVNVIEVVNSNIPDKVEVETDIDEDIPLDYLLKIIQELPDRYRLVFNLYVLDGYTHKEIAEMLEISSGTSKSNLARAKMILKEKLEQSHSQSKSYSIK
ncbi:MAG: sigma-70 family RNA polymerase sigma factor [Flavobacteriaceae bacterium]